MIAETLLQFFQAEHHSDIALAVGAVDWNIKRPMAARFVASGHGCHVVVVPLGSSPLAGRLIT